MPSVDAFRNLTVPSVHVSENHSHPHARSNRTGAAFAISNYITSQGYKPYVVSMAKRDLNNPDLSGTRYYYQVRDLAMDYRNDEVEDDHIITMVDVDYYTDMRAWLSKGQPIIMYTFVPTGVAGETDDALYTFVNNRLRMEVHGGAKYEHKLWDYSVDHITQRVYRKLKWYKPWTLFDTAYWFGELIFYSVHKYAVPGCPDRRIIALIPERRFWGIPTWWCPQQPLKRLKLAQHEGLDGSVYNVACVTRDKKQYISVGHEDQYTSIEIPYDVFFSIRENFKASVYKNVGNIERALSQAKVPDASLKAPLLFSVLTNGVTAPPTLSVVGVGYLRAAQEHSNYQTTFPLVTEIGKERARVVLPPLMEPDCVSSAPVDSYNNDVCCIKERIDKVRNSKVPPKQYLGYAAEFVRLTVPEVGLGTPIHLDTVLEKQNGKFQRMRNAMALMWLVVTSVFVKAFQKAEFYFNRGPSRNISTTPVAHTLLLSQFTYAFKEQVLKRHKWFVPCLTPSEIAQAVRDFVRELVEVVIGDFSKFDGTISVWLRENVQIPLYIRWVSPAYIEVLEERLRSEIHANGVTREGVLYKTEGTTLSGSAITTDGNTEFNAFHQYCAARLAGFSPEDAYCKIGLCYGDDGLACIPPKYLVQAAEDLGLKLKSYVVPKHNSISFLGRLFIDPWTTPTSIQDPLRTIPKIHASVAPRTVSDAEAGRRRIAGYLVTDPYTPVISNYCKAVTRVLGAAPTDIGNPDLSYSGKLCLETNDSWPQDRDDYQLMLEVVANEMKTTPNDIIQISKQLDEAKTFEDFPVGVFSNKPENKIKCLVGGVIHHMDDAEVVVQIPIVGDSMNVNGTNTTGTPRDNSKRKRSYHRRGKNSGSSANTGGTITGSTTVSQPNKRADSVRNGSGSRTPKDVGTSAPPTRIVNQRNAPEKRRREATKPQGKQVPQKPKTPQPQGKPAAISG